jgi:hypothetical protein
MPTHISLSNIACSSRSVSVFGSRLEPVSCVLWVSICEAARPNPARPGPWRPHPPARPLLSLSLSFGSPAQQPPSPSSTSLSPWCRRDWRRRSPEFGPRGELPSPSLLLSLPLPPLPFPARPLSLPCARRSPAPPRPRAAALAPRPGPSRRRRPPPPRPFRRGPPAPAPSAQCGSAPSAAASARRRAPCPRRVAPGARPRPPARGVPALGVARVALAWPRAPPFTPSVFPHAQPHARGDYSFFFVSFKLRYLACCVARFVARLFL